MSTPSQADLRAAGEIILQSGGIEPDHIPASLRHKIALIIANEMQPLREAALRWLNYSKPKREEWMNAATYVDALAQWNALRAALEMEKV